MMIESVDNPTIFIVHEECYQMSGDDEGYVEILHRLIKEDDEDFFSFNRL